MALVDLDSFYVAGYFEETKLSHIHIGMPATIHIMGEVHSMQGHVQSLSAGIEDRERTTASGTLLANVNPTFSWRSAEHTSELQSLMRIPYAVFCLKKKQHN